MSLQWRNHADHKSETTVVKAAVIAAGFPRVTIGHGTGTAWAWLKLRREPEGQDRAGVSPAEEASMGRDLLTALVMVGGVWAWGLVRSRIGG